MYICIQTHIFNNIYHYYNIGKTNMNNIYYQLYKY